MCCDGLTLETGRASMRCLAFDCAVLNLSFGNSIIFLFVAGTQWEQIASLLPAKKVQEPRMADFRRFAQLQEMLRVGSLVQ